MQVGLVNNINVTTPKLRSNVVQQAVTPSVDQVSFAGSDDRKKNKAVRDALIAMSMLAATTSPMYLTSCDKDDFGYARAEAHAWAGIGSYIDSTHCSHPVDTIVKWWYAYQRPIPLDSLYNNLDNWDIDGTDGNMNDSTSRRNIIHYEGVRDWEYNTKEIGDMNILESSRKILVYDTEIKDYKGKHMSYGKRVLRIPSGSFSITTKDGRTLNNPKGLFVEEYENEFGEKNGSILDCKIKSRAFVQTNGDTLNVARRKGTAEFVETGRVAKGYLGANSILLKNLIGQYPTDDHYIDFKVEAVEDNRLRAMYVEAMDKKED